MRPPLLTLVLTLAACAASTLDWSATGRAPRDVPPVFVPDTAAAPSAVPTGTCLVHLRDPRDGTRLLLVRSASTEQGAPGLRGDYEADRPGRYDLGPGDLLRLDCTSGTVVGVVRR
ncbi:MAG: hypothetical protein AB7I33_11935 [Gemmatimonadales bacterium]